MRYLYVPEMCCYLLPLSVFAFLKQRDPNARSRLLTLICHTCFLCNEALSDDGMFDCHMMHMRVVEL